MFVLSTKLITHNKILKYYRINRRGQGMLPKIYGSQENLKDTK